MIVGHNILLRFCNIYKAAEPLMWGFVKECPFWWVGRFVGRIYDIIHDAVIKKC